MITAQSSRIIDGLKVARIQDLLFFVVQAIKIEIFILLLL